MRRILSQFEEYSEKLLFDSLTTDADKSKLLPRGLLECSMKFQNLLIKPVCLHIPPVSLNLIKIYLCRKQRKFA